MDLVQSWLDAKEVRRMADSLMAPPPEVGKSALDAGYGDDFEGFAESVSNEVAASSSRSPVPRPDGRPHAQKQFVKPTAPPTPNEEPQRAAVGNALADARRVAEDSGMLQSGHANSDARDISNPVESSHPVSVAPPQHNSPFKVSVDQHRGDTDPVARQLSPAVGPSDAQVTPPDLIYSDQSGDREEPATPQSQPTEHSFQPESEVEPSGAQYSPAQQVPAEPIAPSPPEIEDTHKPVNTDRAVARSPFLSRLQQFSSILRRDLNAKAMFLIDNEGQVLLDEVENPKLIQVARTLANASYRASRQTVGAAAVGNLHVKIGASATLEVVPVESSYGLLILGAIFPAPLGAERVMQVAELLYKTVEPSS
ncbi:MAG: hypothetical protein QNL01_08110 [Akkermansiaceae bacterium]|tara:strand:+ start:9675 stop:10775 length:1101 start_codon:yes stop_codon:yes gene_type:complete